MNKTPKDKVRIRDGYSIPAFTGGSILLTIEKLNGESVMTIAVGMKGDTREAQEEYIASERLRIAGYVDLINMGIAHAELANKLRDLPPLPAPETDS